MRLSAGRSVLSRLILSKVPVEEGSRQWSIVLIGVVVFMMAVEGCKWLKRLLARRNVTRDEVQA